MSGNYVRKQIHLAMEYAKQSATISKWDHVDANDLLILGSLQRALDGLDGLVARESRCNKCIRMAKSVRRFLEGVSEATEFLDEAVRQSE